MPAKMQLLGHLSPLSWGLDAINDIYLRNGSFGYVWKNVLKLVFAGLAMLAMAGWVEKRRMN
jgi:ABC-2 type transport system permease protein